MKKKYFGSTLGLTVLQENPSTPAKGMVANITSKYNTGFLVGDIRGAWLMDSVAETVSNPATVLDRSVKNNPLTVYGSLTKAAVAAGASTMAYSGFSAANYLQQEYNSDLDFGTGDFCVMGWANITSFVTFQTLLNRSLAGSTGGLIVSISAGASLLYVHGTATTAETVILSVAPGIAVNTPFFLEVKRSAGVLSIGINGKILASVANATDLTYVNAVTRIGVTQTGTSLTVGSLSLWRISATAPSAEQVKFIYDTELPLFQPGAQGILPGTSDSVLALGYDEISKELVGETSYGSFKFKDLLRTSSEATAVGVPTCIAAHGGRMISGGSTGMKAYVPARNLSSELKRQREQAKAFGASLEPFWFLGATSVITFVMKAGWKPKYVYNAGALVKDGATAQYTITYNGFLYSIVFAVAPTAGNHICVMAVQGAR